MGSIVTLKNLKRSVAAALASCHDELTVRFDSGALQGTEQIFGQAVYAELQIIYPAVTAEKRLSDIDMLQFFVGRSNGRVDAYDEKSKTAWEYKIIRLPRNQHNPLWDFGQIAADYLRLNRSKGLREGFFVICMYGPLVEDATSDLNVYRRLHDQMYIERAKCLKQNRFASGSDYDVASIEMTFDSPSEDKPDWVEIIRHGRLAALLYVCR